ncbi:hypothetical protein JTB14_037485 [Gonioctena quinquepunctata]|nr:hypothetical protein JTB14_037485 [Gonioctena quinquepunctata]
MIIDGANQTLLGGKACLNMKLIRTVNIVLKDIDYKNDAFIKLNIDVFEGSGQFPGRHKITTTIENFESVIENFESVSYLPVRIPLAIRLLLKNELDRQVKALHKVDDIDCEQ